MQLSLIYNCPTSQIIFTFYFNLSEPGKSVWPGTLRKRSAIASTPSHYFNLLPLHHLNPHGPCSNTDRCGNQDFGQVQLCRKEYLKVLNLSQQFCVFISTPARNYANSVYPYSNESITSTYPYYLIYITEFQKLFYSL